jgi:hypothetical protein
MHLLPLFLNLTREHPSCHLNKVYQHYMVVKLTLGQNQQPALLLPHLTTELKMPQL